MKKILKMLSTWLAKSIVKGCDKLLADTCDADQEEINEVTAMRNETVRYLKAGK